MQQDKVAINELIDNIRKRIEVAGAPPASTAS